VVPPAPEDGERREDVVPPARADRAAGLRVPDGAGVRPAEEERVAGLLADAVRDVAVRDDAGLLADDDADVRDDAGLLADDDADVRDDPGVLADVRDAAGLRAAGVDRPADVVDRFAAEEAARRAPGFLAAERLAAGRRVVDALAPPELCGPASSADTRSASPSTSVRRPLSSASTRSSSTSRMRFAATAKSPAMSCARLRVDWAPSAVAEKVRSTAARTASTASTAPTVALSFLPLFFFASFFAIAARS